MAATAFRQSAAPLVLAAVLALIITQASAQTVIPSGRSGGVAPNSPLGVICGQPDLSQFCQLLRSSSSDPIIAQLSSPTFVGTIFAPTDKGLQATNSRIKSNLGVGIENLPRNPADAANLLKNHIVVGQALSSPQLTNDLKLKTAYGNTIEIDKGFLYGTYVKGERNTVTITSDRDILAGQAYIHKVDGAIVPKLQGKSG